MTEHHKARRLALQALCCLDVQGPSGLELLEAFIQDSRENLQTVAEARRILHQAFAVRDQADALLEGQSRHWNISRMALVDRNILRLAVWELLAGKAPKKVVISEALKLAKEFATAESSRFINGVLDAAATRLSRDAEDAKDKGLMHKEEEELAAAAEEEEEEEPAAAAAEEEEEEGTEETEEHKSEGSE